MYAIFVKYAKYAICAKYVRYVRYVKHVMCATIIFNYAIMQNMLCKIYFVVIMLCNNCFMHVNV